MDSPLAFFPPAAAWLDSWGGRAGAETAATTSKTTAANSANDLTIMVSSVAGVWGLASAAVRFLFDAIIGPFESELHHVFFRPGLLPLLCAASPAGPCVVYVCTCLDLHSLRLLFWLSSRPSHLFQLRTLLPPLRWAGTAGMPTA